jgi:signal peptidase I
MSASMEPAIDTGDLVVVGATGGSPEIGDVVAVPVPAEIQERLRYPEEVIHRVVEITDDGLVRTQGDNLPEPDPFGVPVSSVKTRVITVVPGAGRILAFATSPYGLAWLLAGLVLFGVMPFFDSQRELHGAVAEYGYHLRSHTAILKSMSEASQELSDTVVELRKAITEDRSLSEASRELSETVVELRKAITEDRAARPTADVALPRDPARDRPVLYDDERNPLVDPVLR